jgi:hypothetical protein
VIYYAFANAFDEVNHEILLSCITMGVGKHIAAWITNFLSHGVQ